MRCLKKDEFETRDCKMELRYKNYSLQLKHAFTITRGTRTEVPVVLTEIEHDGVIGRGEASPSARYGETIETVRDFLQKFDSKKYSNPFAREEILTDLKKKENGNHAAIAAIDIAMHDWIGKKLGIPLRTFFGLYGIPAPLSSFTIGYDSIETVKSKIIDAKSYPILKIKLGFENDIEIIKLVRQLTTARIRVDANEGWQTKEIALDRINQLVKYNVEFVEQPMPANLIDEMIWLKSRSPIPLIADESVTTSDSIFKWKDAFHGINIKLMKCGGLNEALRMISVARVCGMKVMIGCMIETSIGITAAAQIAALCDYADLDGALLTTNDPFHGVVNNYGEMSFPDKPGLGIQG